MVNLIGTKEEKAIMYGNNWDELNPTVDYEDTIGTKIAEIDFLAGYNEAEKDYSELLKQRNEMLELLQMIHRVIKEEDIIIQENWDNDGYENLGSIIYSKAEKLIQQSKV